VITCCEILVFENYGQEVGGNTLLVPQPKRWKDQSPLSLWLLCLWFQPNHIVRRR